MCVRMRPFGTSLCDETAKPAGPGTQLPHRLHGYISRVERLCNAVMMISDVVTTRYVAQVLVIELKNQTLVVLFRV
jgi:hypothetical protein